MKITTLLSVLILGAILAGAVLIGVAHATDSTPSNHTGDAPNVAHKSNAEDFSGPNSTNSTQGRFQLFGGETWIASGSNTSHVPVVLKLDSQTGRTWLLVLMDSTNGSQMGFAELPNVQHK